MVTESLIPATERRQPSAEATDTENPALSAAMSFEQELNPWLAQEARFDYAAASSTSTRAYGRSSVSLPAN